MSSPVRFGILGAARIAPAALVAPSAKLSTVAVTRIAARDRDRAEAFAATHDIPAVSTSYQELVEADDVDVVYNPLPISLHAEWSIAALRAGKHVLCEKPLASNADEARRMVDVAEAEGRVLAEAFHYWYHPMFGRIVDEVRSGRIGTVHRLEGRFDVTVDEPNIRWDYDTGGGSLMDLGCYPVSWVRRLMAQEPTVVSARAEIGPPDVDGSVSAELAFPSGATAAVHSSMTSDRSVELAVIGDRGRIEATNPMSPQNGNNLVIETEGGQTAGPVEAGTSYEHMIRAFVDHLVHGAPFPTQGQDSIANMAVIDAIYDAAGLPLRGRSAR